MLNAMRTLALDYLFQKLVGGEPPDNLEDRYQDLRINSLEKLFPFLVEDTEKIEKVFIIRKLGDSDSAELRVEEMKPETSKYLPFVKPSGSQSGQIGPVIKRTYTKQKGGSPTGKILNTTMNDFGDIAKSDKPWSPYFKEIVAVLESDKIKLTDGEPTDWKSEGYESLLECVVQRIGELKGTVIVTVEDNERKLPGQRPEYLQYLMNEKLAGDRYLTGKVRAVRSICPLCGTADVDVFPNALKGAGLNLLNMDRIGVFPGIDEAQAWKGFSLCAACADLLYVYKNHVLKKVGAKKGKMPFTAKIAGESKPALVIPFCTLNAGNRQDLLMDVNRFIKNVPDDVEEDEESLLDILKDEKGLLNLTFLWADIGQNIENVTGMLTDVPPSRLRALSQFNELSKQWKHPLFPQVRLTGKLCMQADLSLRALNPLFDRPGGKKAQKANESKKLFQLKRLVAAAVYHKTAIPEKVFWNEVLTTARWWWLDAIKSGESYGLLHEGKGKKGPYLTTAGWVRHLARWLYYFRQLEVMEMSHNFFVPEMEALKPYFGPESGINSPEKAYTFLIGVLYGKLLEVQGARGINVGANALTWLKRLTLRGSDLPELYVKIREKLLAYETEKSRKVRELIQEIGKLGIRLGDSVELDQTRTNYYLLLGQSMASTILKKEEKGEVKE